MCVFFGISSKKSSRWGVGHNVPDVLITACWIFAGCSRLSQNWSNGICKENSYKLIVKNTVACQHFLQSIHICSMFYTPGFSDHHRTRIVMITLLYSQSTCHVLGRFLWDQPIDFMFIIVFIYVCWCWCCCWCCCCWWCWCCCGNEDQWLLVTWVWIKTRYPKMESSPTHVHSKSLVQSISIHHFADERDSTISKSSFSFDII